MTGTSAIHPLETVTYPRLRKNGSAPPRAATAVVDDVQNRRLGVVAIDGDENFEVCKKFDPPVFIRRGGLQVDDPLVRVMLWIERVDDASTETLVRSNFSSDVLGERLPGRDLYVDNLRYRRAGKRVAEQQDNDRPMRLCKNPPS